MDAVATTQAIFLQRQSPFDGKEYAQFDLKGFLCGWNKRKLNRIFQTTYLKNKRTVNDIEVWSIKHGCTFQCIRFDAHVRRWRKPRKLRRQRFWNCRCMFPFLSSGSRFLRLPTGNRRYTRNVIGICRRAFLNNPARVRIPDEIIG